MSHRFHDLSAEEALIGVLNAQAREKALGRALEAIDQGIAQVKADPTLRTFRGKEYAGTGITPIEAATNAYRAVSRKLIAAKHSHLLTHKRSPLLQFRHRDHWTGWAIRFRYRTPDEPGDSLEWTITHKTAKPAMKGDTETYYDGDKLCGSVRRSTTAPGHGILDLLCDCRFAYYDDVSMHIVMADAANDLDRETPRNADGRIYLRLPVE